MKTLFYQNVVIGMLLFVFCLVSSHLDAQTSNSKEATTWLDLGMNLPEDYPRDAINLFQGLNKARGEWTFEARTTGASEVSVEGKLNVMGNPQSGMMPMWRMTWSWPAEKPTHAVMYIIGAGPRRNGFDLMLTRVGPVENPESDKPRPRVSPTIFGGSWDSKTRILTWIEGRSQPRASAQDSEKDSSQPKQSFQMIVAADGMISIRNSEHMPEGQMAVAATKVRTAEPTKQPSNLAGKHHFQSASEIKDPRIAPWLPSQATEISLVSERGGHFARYQVAEKDLMDFLNQLWENEKGNSAHERDSMSGEGEPASKETMLRRFQRLGWEPLENAIIYYSPSKRSGAMTTYYYDRESGIVYHDRGYW